MVQNGLYRHFKGDIYRVVGMARHTETDELLALYHQIGNPLPLFARPLNMFMETVEHDGKKLPRFEFLRV